VFEKNAEARVGVLNGYTGTVRAVAKAAIDSELDGGRMVRFDPKAYPHLDYGWATTTHKSQVAAIRSSSSARSRGTTTRAPRTSR